ncbi:SL9A2-like protein [Mya arenaria]|uniref:SL9A2-like protein n=1 Tax=Mya arenaria TaxID=6604 RepID=A0ABY7GA64_MYAAR|nr:SL9A2-like protein [Mya arenaria]
MAKQKMAGARWMIIGFVLTIGVDYTYCSTTTITTASSNELPETNDQNSPKFTSSPSQSTKRIESTGTGTHSPTTTTSETDSQPTAQPSQNSTESIHNDTGPHSTTDSHGDGTTQHKVIGGHEKDDHDTTHGIELFTFNFSNVKYPLVFSLVVILAGLSKIGFHYSHFLSSKLHWRFGEPYPVCSTRVLLVSSATGTVMNCFLIGLSMWGLYQAGAMEDVQCTLVQFLIFSALIVAVDPVAVLAVFQEIGVNNTLYFLVFGESLLNDGVTVVLYNVMHVFNKIDTISAGQVFLGVAKFLVVVGFGLLIGIFCGLVSSIITKYTNSIENSTIAINTITFVPVVEPLIVFGFAYLSYILSDLFEFSGIISIIACGIIQVHYAFQNITNKSRMGVKFFSKVMATASEIIIFLFLGNVTVKTSHAWMTGFSLWALLLCILYRFLTTYGISFFLNKYSTGRVRKIRLDEMFMIGGTIKWLVKKLRVKLADKDKDMSLNEEISNHRALQEPSVKRRQTAKSEDRYRLHLNVHDKNLTHDKQHHLISQLRKKYRQNMAIRERRERESLEQGQTLPSHSLSFNMDGSRAYEERKPSQVQFTLDDTEQEEAETEHTQGTDIEYDENGKATFMF